MSQRYVGLTNPVRAHHCFLNVILQALWNEPATSRYFLESTLAPAAASAKPSAIVDAIGVLYASFAHAEDPSLPPDVVRNALADVFSHAQRFRLGEMEDAVEVFESVLLELHGSDQRDAPCAYKGAGGLCLAHRVFALQTMENTWCPDCGATSGCDRASAELISRLYAYELFAASRSGEDDEPWPLTRALRELMVPDASSVSRRVACPGTRCPASMKTAVKQRFLLNLPMVWCVSVVWPAASSEEVRRAVSRTLRESRRVNIHDAFDASESENDSVSTGVSKYNEYRLSGFVAYYGAHYVYFGRRDVVDPDSPWCLYDDESVKMVGKWRDVEEKLVKGAYQPVLIFMRRSS